MAMMPNLDLSHFFSAPTLAWGTSQHAKVEQLAQTSAGAVLAWVDDDTLYATMVFLTADTLFSSCSCSVGYRCKHAAAVALAYQQAQTAKDTLPLANENDGRLVLLTQAGVSATDTSDDDDFVDEYESDVDSDDDEDDEDGSPGSMYEDNDDGDDSTLIAEYLASLPQPALVKLLLRLSDQYSDVFFALRSKARRNH
jgi:hypothetical protein